MRGHSFLFEFVFHHFYKNDVFSVDNCNETRLSSTIGKLGYNISTRIVAFQVNVHHEVEHMSIINKAEAKAILIVLEKLLNLVNKSCVVVLCLYRG